jgi:hypothetical protein
MSPSGTISDSSQLTSAFGGKADIEWMRLNVRL